VLRDFRNELTTLVYAREIYGVVIDAQKMEVDKEATRALRTELASRAEAAPKVP
jgi:N-methylhydantoinase B